MTIENLKERIKGRLDDNPRVSFTAEKISAGLGLSGADNFKKVVTELAGLERAKEIQINQKGEFQAIPQPLRLTGTFHGNDKGFGFVAVSDDDPDVYINPDHTLHAMNNDGVEIEILRPAAPGSDRGPEGAVTKIVDHHYTTIVGEYQNNSEDNEHIGTIVIKDKKISSYKFLVTGKGLNPTDGEMVLATIDEYPTNEHPKRLVGTVQQVIGSKDEPGVDILSVMFAHDVPHEFPQEVLEQADAISETISPQDRVGREDITDQPLVTIDSIESKDLDDAVVAWKMANGNYHLGVHIANVSNYVPEGTPLDHEAYERGTSVYLTDRVVPMLPRRLSNGICSLNPDVDRLSMSCEMEINTEGQVVNHRIFQSVMRSHARMTYKSVNAILEAHDKKTRERYAELVPMFETMGELHRILLKSRKRHGAIDFDAPEAQIIVDSNGHPTDIELRDRGLSERMIESFMLAANETVAEHWNKLKVPFIYRVHETPDGQKIKTFFEFLSVFGHQVIGDPNALQPKMLQNVLKNVAGTPEEAMVQMMMLRSMMQAKYSEQNSGHFGLGAQYYTHFTSPIRRYPDLMVHRLIRWYTTQGITDESKARYKLALPQIAEHTSKTERRGIDTERDVDAMKKAEFMEDKVGETFDAVISSVMKFGLFVELENTVEGLVHISVMNDDYYEYVDKHMALVGRNHHRIFQVGQAVKVKLMRVDKDQREVDFELVNPNDAPLTKLHLPKREQHSGGQHSGRSERNSKTKFKHDQGSISSHGNQRTNTRQINRGQARRRPNDRHSPQKH